MGIGLSHADLIKDYRPYIRASKWTVGIIFIISHTYNRLKYKQSISKWREKNVDSYDIQNIYYIKYLISTFSGSYAIRLFLVNGPFSWSGSHLQRYIRRFGPIHGYWMYPMERLNSWISRRVLNRRFPESTVMASCRLFELSSFLGLTKSLSCDIAADITEDVDLDETDNSFEKEKHLSLCPKLGMELYYTYYKLTQADKVSSMLITQYQKEMRMSKEQRSFPQFTVWLRQKETEHESQTTKNTSPLLEISNQVQSCQYYSIPDKFGRIIKFSSM